MDDFIRAMTRQTRRALTRTQSVVTRLQAQQRRRRRVAGDEQQLARRGIEGGWRGLSVCGPARQRVSSEVLLPAAAAQKGAEPMGQAGEQPALAQPVTPLLVWRRKRIDRVLRFSR